VTFNASKGIMGTLTSETGMLRMEDAPKTISVPAAGKKYYGLGKNASYAAAARGEMPVIKIGSRLRAPVVALERQLAEAGSHKAK
jgi:hypothetical protein